MKISQDVRDYAAGKGIGDVNIAIEQGMSDKAEEFKRRVRKSTARFDDAGITGTAGLVVCRRNKLNQ